MGRRWTPDDVANLKQLAPRYPTPLIAQMMNRTVGGVTFKAHQLEVPLRARGKGEGLIESAELDWA